MNNVQQANVQQAIRDAAEKGGYRYRWWKVNDLGHTEGYNGLQLRALPEHFCDPDFWKALATARKWEDVMPRAFTGTASSTTLQMEKMLRVFSPLYEKQMLAPTVALSIISPALDHQKNKPCGDP